MRVVFGVILSMAGAIAAGDVVKATTKGPDYLLTAVPDRRPLEPEKPPEPPKEFKLPIATKKLVDKLKTQINENFPKLQDKANKDNKGATAQKITILRNLGNQLFKLAEDSGDEKVAITLLGQMDGILFELANDHFPVQSPELQETLTTLDTVLDISNILQVPEKKD